MDHFHLMAKPAGPRCNLNCNYCFYLEKSDLYENKNGVMSDLVLETYIRKYIQSQKSSYVEFTWQGGEPTLAGIDFFQKAMKYQRIYGKGKQIANALQTNGTLINDAWCRFLKENHFLVGLSLDGPEDIHNVYRKDRAGQNTFHLVEKTIALLNRYKIEFNILTTVNAINSQSPLEIYKYYKKMGIQFIQFIPIVEREMTSTSVEPSAYADFLIQIFDEWVRHDIGKIYIMNFEWALSSFIYGGSGTCHFDSKCGATGIIEHNGDVYACDHYVYPNYKIGNVITDDLYDIFHSKRQVDFGNQKQETLTDNCRNCQYLSICNGGCPKHRFNEGQNYLCEAYKNFFNHIAPYAKKARLLISRGRPLTELMAFDNVD